MNEPATLEKAIFNVEVARTRTEFLDGVEYLVAPVSMIVEGVLNGSKGPLLYPKEELARSVPLWNNMPLVLYHPFEEGKPVSARQPTVLEKRGIGVLFNTSHDGNRLLGEAWFNKEKTARVDNRVIKALEERKPIELSTGLYADQEPAPEGAVFNSKEYKYIARNYQPDHLAILPDQVGACSLKDGCGVLVNSDSDNERSQTLAEYLTFLTNQPSHAELFERLAKLVMDRYGERAWIVDVYDKYVVYRIADKLWKIGYVTDLRSEDSVELVNETPIQVTKVVKYTPVANSFPSNPEETSVNKSQLIEALVNCNCGWTKEDETLLNSLSEEKLKALQPVNGSSFDGAAKKGAMELVGNSSPTPVEKKPLTEEEWLASAPPSVVNTFNYAKTVENRERESIINKLTANVADEKREALKVSLGKKSLTDLQELEALIPVAPVANTEQSSVPYYVGSPATGTGTPLKPIVNNRPFDKDDILPVPGY